ncbi:YdcF family protein [Nocardia farcinica]|nr:YdcF family protein [Nocardia farcinica]MBF6538290.1 YdcF family protein [Nocardia farcinica]
MMVRTSRLGTGRRDVRDQGDSMRHILSSTVRAATRALLAAAALATGLAAPAVVGATPLDLPPLPGLPEPGSRLGFRGPDTAIVVLGYGLLPDGAMRPELVERLRAGYAQALLAPASPIIVTGGNPRNGTTEAAAMADWLVARGIPPARVHRDDRATTTRENAEYAARILAALGARDAVVVTSGDHVPRAVALFRAAGIEVAAALTPEEVPALALPFGR